MTASDNPLRTLGHQKHTMYALSSRKGCIEGIENIKRAEPIEKDGLDDFEFLNEGEAADFPEGGDVEIVSFGAYFTNYFVWKSDLRTYEVDLKPGAKLAGPLVWRDRSQASSKRGEDANWTSADTWDMVGVLSIPAVLTAILAWFWPTAVVGVYGGVLMLVCLLAILTWWAGRRLKGIVRTGSVLVRAPAARPW